MRRVLALCLPLLACAHGGEAFRIRPDAEKLAARNAFVAGPRLTPKDPVNVVLLVADDLGRADVSMYGDTRVATPNIDAIAKQGVAFGAGYVTSPLCSPSRAGLLTGRSQQRYGHEGQPHERYARNGLEYFVFKHFIASGDWRLLRWVAPDDEDVQRQGLPLSEVTLAEVLKRVGYATGAFGKWHLGWSPDFQPHRRGFDEHFGVYEAYTLYQADVDDPGIVNQRHDDFSERFIWGKGRTGTATLRRNDVPVDDPGYLTDRLADEAVAFVERNADRPFFLYVPFTAPHTPFQAKRELVDRFKGQGDENRQVYLAMIASLDEAVGRIVAALEARGLAQRTLIIFVSDNGGALYTKATTNAPFRGGKFSFFEGGVRVPFAMRWDGHIPAGSRFDHPVSTLDVMTTVAAATGAPLPTDRAYDGVDLVPFLRGEQPGPPHEALYWRAEYLHAIRRGKYKLVHDTLSGALALFDLDADPGEAKDLAKERPEVVEALEEELSRVEATQWRPPLWPHVMDYHQDASDGREWWYPL